jgi:dienelactone hydrolase
MFNPLISFTHAAGLARTWVSAALVLLALPLAWAQNASSNPPDPVPERVSITVPGVGTLGSDAQMLTQVFKPEGAGPHPVLLFAHGRAGDAASRVQLKQPVPLGHVRYWLGRGYAVVAPVRPGYGESGGADLESSGAGYSDSGSCTRQPDHSRTAKAAIHAMGFALNWVREQPWANKDRILLEGQSVGGLATVALCASQPPGVVGCINFAGGAGGDPARAPGKMCAPEKMTELMRSYGQSTRLPSIWLYAENDLYWGADPPRQWHAAFAQALAEHHKAPHEFIQTPALEGNDGHRLLHVGGRLWSVPLNAWLKKHGL